jgi:hypothetical protein
LRCHADGRLDAEQPFKHSADSGNGLDLPQRGEQLLVIAGSPVGWQFNAKLPGCGFPNGINRLTDKDALRFIAAQARSMSAEDCGQHPIGYRLAVDENAVTVEDHEIEVHADGLKPIGPMSAMGR